MRYTHIHQPAGHTGQRCAIVSLHANGTQAVINLGPHVPMASRYPRVHVCDLKQLQGPRVLTSREAWASHYQREAAYAWDLIQHCPAEMIIEWQALAAASAAMARAYLGIR